MMACDEVSRARAAPASRRKDGFCKGKSSESLSTIDTIERINYPNPAIIVTLHQGRPAQVLKISSGAKAPLIIERLRRD